MNACINCERFVTLKVITTNTIVLCYMASRAGCDYRSSSQYEPVKTNMAKVRRFEDYVMTFTMLAFRSLHFSKLGAYLENETS